MPTLQDAPIGVFDSGVGGLSVLAALRRRLPGHPLHYVADIAHAPYGERGDAYVMDRTARISEHLLRSGAGLLVVACNTATAQAIALVRERHPELPVVGVEPGVKPAVAASLVGRVGVLATPGTLASARFAALVERHAQGCQVLPMPCPGLAAAIEQGDAGAAEVERLLDGFCAPLRAAGVDVVALGCTHYVFVADRIAARLPGVRLIDTADAVARQAQNLIGPAPVGLAMAAPLRLQSTGATHVLARMAARALDDSPTVEQVAI